MGKLSLYYIFHWLFISSTAENTNVSWATLCEKKITITQVTPPEIWKKKMPDILAESYNTNISECLCVNLRTVLMIRKELDVSNSDYEARKTMFVLKKITPEIWRGKQNQHEGLHQLP